MAVTPFELTEPFSTDTFNSRINEINTKIIPTGTVFWLASETIPEGFLLCDGASVSREDYASLFNVIGTTFGSDNDTTFKLPDLRAKFVRGAGSSNGYSATFGNTQESTAFNAWAYGGSPINADSKLIPSSSGAYGLGSWSDTRSTNLITLRPYNIALTPVIKYI